MKKETICSQENQNFLLLSQGDQLNIFNSNMPNCSQYLIDRGRIHNWINDFIKKIATAKIKQSYSFRKIKAKNFIELQDGLNYKHVIKLSSEDPNYCKISLSIKDNEIVTEDIPSIIRRECRYKINNYTYLYLPGIVYSILKYQNPNILSLINKNLPNLELCKEIFLNKNINDDFDKTKINEILNCIKKLDLDEEEFKFLINISDIPNFRSHMLSINNLVKKFSISEEEISKAFEWKTIKDILE